MPIFYFRNDDVNTLDDALVEVTHRCTTENVPITHAVEPANITDKTVAWLHEEISRDPRLVEIMQHGYDHEWRDKGEFGGKRPYADQYADLSKGRDILLERFGDEFLPCLNFPFGPYNQSSMQAADQLGFRIVCSHYNCRFSRRLLYKVGHTLGRGQIAGKHVSYHLGTYPGTQLFCIDMAISFIDRYLGPHGSCDCEFHDAASMEQRARTFTGFTPVVGVLLHHRFHKTEESLNLITDLIRRLKSIPEAEFLNIEEIYQRFCPNPGDGFREVV